MKKILTIIFLIAGFSLPLYAAHIKGGEIVYTYIGPGTVPNSSEYQVSLKLYIDCGATSPGQLDTEVSLSVFNAATNGYVSSYVAAMSSETFLRFDPSTNPCIGNPPMDVCYRVRTYSIRITLNNNEAGYIISYQRCCRIIDIRNLSAPSNSYGATYFCQIPGSNVITDAYKNNSPHFITNDAAAICSGSAFTFNFGAQDDDASDSLVYALCNGYIGASQSLPNPTVASTPPYTALTYSAGYSGTNPLGPSVKIDRNTGIVTGIAPTMLGQYVISACAYEYRQGKLINIHRKDIHVAVSDCVPLNAFLKPDYSFCDDFNVTFRNETINPPGSVYTWEFGDGSAPVTTESDYGFVQHQYNDTGTYTVRLKVVLAGQCIDSTTTRARVYPGFFPGFTSLGSCKFTPFQFNDTTKSRYGRVSSWRWSFGDVSVENDTSLLKSPTWLYNNLGIQRVELIVQSDKGCIDTVYKEVEVRDIPLMSLAFNDTLICSIDSLRLNVSGNGIFQWSPQTNMIGANTANPLVFPKTTTRYKVTLNENGCINSDSVLVNVVDFVSLNAGPDQTICATDTTLLSPQTNGLRFSWTPSETIIDPALKNAQVFPAATTQYIIESSIGKCTARDAITVRTVPYPFVNAGADTIICFQDTARLNAQIIASRFSWNPANTLSNSSVLNPLAYPAGSTTYILTAYDTLGCPKPGMDDVTVTVMPEINAFAGNDTAIVIGQPLRLMGQGAELFEWQPAFPLDRNDVGNPTAMLDNDITFILKAYTENGCFSLDTMKVLVFKSAPDIFVPNAFAPLGRNNILKPVAPGITTLHYFRVFNRYGQLMFTTSRTGEGWDGKYEGKTQDSGTYVWMVSGTDFTGKLITKKGTCVLIR